LLKVSEEYPIKNEILLLGYGSQFINHPTSNRSGVRASLTPSLT